MHITLEHIALVGSIALPLCNIPLILKILRRKSSQDISIEWVVGVWICILLMAPSGFMSKDFVWRTYNVLNLLFFTAVVIVVLIYRKGKNS